MYDGPRRPDNEVAKLEAESGTYIQKIDGRPLKVGARGKVELLPGWHSLSADFAISQQVLGFRTVTYSTKSFTVCFPVKAGYDYATYPEVTDRQHWKVDVIERSRFSHSEPRTIWAEPCPEGVPSPERYAGKKP
jgi:hypothetical protein